MAGQRVEEARLVGLRLRDERVLGLVGEERRRAGLGDDVGVVVLDVDRRLDGVEHRRQRRSDGDGLGTGGEPARVPVRAADGVPRAAEERAERRAGEQEQADDEGRHADDRRAGRTEQRGEEPVELASDPAAVRAEREHQPEGADREAGAERAHVDERAAGDHQGADHHERDREHVAGVADDRRDRVRDRTADDSAVPAEVEERAEEDPERDEDEAPELGAVGVGAPGLRPLPLPDPGGRLRA